MTTRTNGAMRQAHDAGSGLRYTNVAIALHWAMAALIVYNLTSGLLGAVLPRGFFALHISSGITILVLTIVRILWRLTHKPPPMLPMAPWERGLAHAVHVLLYAAMLLMPFSGWAMVSAHPPAGSPGAVWASENPPPRHGEPPAVPAARAVNTTKASAPAPKRPGPIMIWNVIPLPMIGPVSAVGQTPRGVPEQRELHERIETVHLIGGWIMLALLVLHIAGALKHQLVDRRRELARMGLGTPEPAV